MPVVAHTASALFQFMNANAAIAITARTGKRTQSVLSANFYRSRSMTDMTRWAERITEIEGHLNLRPRYQWIIADRNVEWLLESLRTAQAEIATDHAREEKITQALEAVVAEERKLCAENARLRAVVDAARKLKFGAYPAHGSGFVTIVTEGGVRELRDAFDALDAAEGKTT